MEFEDLSPSESHDSKQLSPDIYCTISRQFRKDGRPEEALNLLQQGLHIFPESVKLHHELGMVFTRTGDEKKALEVLEKAILLLASHMKVLTSIATLYKAQGDQVRAVAAFKVFLAFEQLLKMMTADDLNGWDAASPSMTIDPDQKEDKGPSDEVRSRRIALHKMELLLKKIRARTGAQRR